MAKLPKISVVNASNIHSATLFLFHGSGIFILLVNKFLFIIDYFLYEIINRRTLKVIFHIIYLLLFIFHISGATGSNFKEWIDILNREELKFPHIKIIYPTAPLQPYTPLHGMVIW